MKTEPIISLKRVAFSYDESPMFTDLNLDIDSGMLVGFQGASGSGKSTASQADRRKPES